MGEMQSRANTWESSLIRSVVSPFRKRSQNRALNAWFVSKRTFIRVTNHIKRMMTPTLPALVLARNNPSGTIVSRVVSVPSKSKKTRLTAEAYTGPAVLC